MQRFNRYLRGWWQWQRMVCVIVGGESEGVSILGPPSSTDAPLGHILIICCEVQVSVMLTLPPPPRCAFVDGSHQGYQRSSCRDSSSNQLKVIHCTPCEHVHQKKGAFSSAAYRSQDPSVLLSTSQRKWSMNITKATEPWPCKESRCLHPHAKSAIFPFNWIACFASR